RVIRSCYTVSEDQFFFVQAEDGIRDFHVTGVQTCALPISVRTVTLGNRRIEVLYEAGEIAARVRALADEIAGANLERLLVVPVQIGRASCRERGWHQVTEAIVMAGRWPGYTGRADTQAEVC